MKNYKSLLVLIFCLIFSNEVLSQQTFGAGAYLGGGVISGNTSEKGSFSSSLFFEIDPGLYKDLSFRFSFLYHTDFNSILPGSTKRYYPYLKGLGLKGITFQNIQPYFFIEEGVGIIALNDRTISGTDEWDYGASFSIAAGFDFRKFENKGFKLSLGTEYGLTFFKTLPSFFTLYFQFLYLI